MQFEFIIGSVTSSDSGHSTGADTHSNSSAESSIPITAVTTHNYAPGIASYKGGKLFSFSCPFLVCFNTC